MCAVSAAPTSVTETCARPAVMKPLNRSGARSPNDRRRNAVSPTRLAAPRSISSSCSRNEDRRARDTQEAAKEAELERQRDVAKRRDDETRRWQEQAAAAIAGVGADAADDATADPYTLLGVTSTASEDEIRAAYATCRAKYAADQVAHLSQDLQDRYRHKAAAVERAFQALTRAS